MHPSRKCKKICEEEAIAAAAIATKNQFIHEISFATEVSLAIVSKAISLWHTINWHENQCSSQRQKHIQTGNNNNNNTDIDFDENNNNNNKTYTQKPRHSAWRMERRKKRARQREYIKKKWNKTYRQIYYKRRKMTASRINRMTVHTKMW